MMRESIQEHLASLSDLDEETLKLSKRVYDFVKYQQATFVSEISWELSMTEYQTKLCLRLLLEQGRIETIPVSQNQPDRRLMRRVADQSARGQGGFDKFSRKRWFGIPEEVI